ncbi:unnamed protein product [Malus baccata var. baccata]
MCEKKARLLETSIDSLVPSTSPFLVTTSPPAPKPSTINFFFFSLSAFSLRAQKSISERGNQRDRDRERAQARSGGNKSKPKNDGLTPEQRRERDAKALQEKAKKKAAAEQAGGINAGTDSNTLMPPQVPFGTWDETERSGTRRSVPRLARLKRVKRAVPRAPLLSHCYSSPHTHSIMASLPQPTQPLPPPFNRPPPPSTVRPQMTLNPHPPPSSSSTNTNANKTTSLAVTQNSRSKILESQKLKDKEAKERKEETNNKIASRKAISVILRREATKALIEKKKKGSKRLLPKTVLEALHERITALRWESALKVFELLQEQLWYRPNAAVYVKLIVMLGKCKQPEKAHELFEAMIEEGCDVNTESYTALVSAYGRSGLFHKAFSLLERMKTTPDCQPDVHTYSILIKSCLQVFAYDKVQALLSDMEVQGIRPNTITYNTLIDAYGKSKRFAEMESTLVEMLSEQDCEPDVWTMNSVLRAFGNSGQIETMEKCFERFQSAGIQANIMTFNILLDSYGKAGKYEKMSAVMEYMQKYHYSWTIVTYNVVIDAFGRAGDLKQMEYLFRLMRSERIKPSCVTLCSLVRAYGLAGKPEKIEGVLRFVENSDVMLDTVFFNCLVDAYGRMGCFAEMKGVLEIMEQKGCRPDKVTYRTMIKAYSTNKMIGHVKELRELMESAEGSQMTWSQREKPDFQ